MEADVGGSSLSQSRQFVLVRTCRCLIGIGTIIHLPWREKIE
ncbi:MAG: hypothetical protein OJF50_005778 [Nitrospira sp.]|nr:hypothetical protein [Nitrospira sp.]